MKNIIVASALIISLLLSACAGMQPVTDPNATFSIVHEIIGKPKDSIFESTKIWIAENFKSAKKVIEYENKTDGVLIGNGSMKFPCSGIECMAKNDWMAYYTMRVDMKDEKIRLTFSNIGMAWPAKILPVGSISSYDGPVATQGEMDAIKRALLVTGQNLAQNLKNSRQTQNW